MCGQLLAPPPAAAGEGGRVAREALGVQVSLQWQRAGGGTRRCGPALALRRLWPGRADALREMRLACRSCSYCDASVAAHTCAALRWPSAGRCRGGLSCCPGWATAEHRRHSVRWFRANATHLLRHMAFVGL